MPWSHLHTRRAARIFTSYAVLLIIGSFTALPFLWMVVTSFQSRGALLSIPPSFAPDLLFSGDPFRNFARALFEFRFTRYLGNSLFIAIMAALGQVVTCTLAGFAFAKMRFRGSGIVFSILIGTMLIPLEVTIVPEFFLMVKLGWLNTYLPLIVPSFLVGTFGTFMMREFFQSIPDELVDAARIDGASPWRIYRSVFLPLSKPGITTLFLVAFIHSWNELLRPVLYITSRDLRPVTVGLTTLQGQFATDWNLLMAGAVLAILPLLILFVVFQRFIVEGIATTGLK